MTVTFGLIGYGNIGHRHAQHIHAHPHSRLGGVYDIRPERMEACRTEVPGTAAYPDLQHLLEDPTIDIVSICTPNAYHAQQAIACLEAGKHVLVEKPMALSVADGEAMIEASVRSGSSLFVVKQNRFNAPVQAVRKLMDEGRLGRIYSVSLNCYWNRNADYYLKSDWKGKLALDGGTLFTQFSHFVDVLYYLFGDLEILDAQLANKGHEGLIEFDPVRAYRMLGQTVRGEVAKRYGLPAVALTTSEIGARMEHAGVDRWIARLVSGLLQ